MERDRTVLRPAADGGGRLWPRAGAGEISDIAGPTPSGHAYFSLKDEGARLDAVVWKGTFARLKLRPEEGLEVWRWAS